MKWWEWIFPILTLGIVLWATIPDLPHFCGWDEYSLMCGIGWIFRLDIWLPASIVLWTWLFVLVKRIERKLK